MKRSKSVERLNVFLSTAGVQGDEEFDSAVLELIRQVRPKWIGSLHTKSKMIDSLGIKVFTDGITNRLIGCYPINIHPSSCDNNTRNNNQEITSNNGIPMDLDVDGLVPSENTTNNRDDDMLLLRIYGEKTELFIDRELEIRNMAAMHQAGLAPPLYAIFQNGICYGYTPGSPLDETLARLPEIYPLVGEMLARMHTVKPKVRKNSNNNTPHINGHHHHVIHAHRNGNNHSPGHHHANHANHHNHLTVIQNGGISLNNTAIDPQPSLFRAMRRFLSLMPSSYADAEMNSRFKSLIPSKDRLEEEVRLLELELTKLDSPIVFCHNDLLMKNIIHTANASRTSSESKSSNGTVTFIDFEYADYNYQAFDIGNHFAEFCGVEPFNPAAYPTRDFQLKWLTNYLEAWHSITHYETLTHDLSPELRNLISDQVQVLYVHVNKFALSAHLFWGVWALIQAANSRIHFDFLQYGAQRIAEYYARKDEFLALKVDE